MRIMQQSILYRIAVFTSESELDIKIAACDFDSEVKHIGIGKNYFCYVARCFVDSALNFAVNSVYPDGFEFCARYADILECRGGNGVENPCISRTLFGAGDFVIVKGYGDIIGRSVVLEHGVFNHVRCQMRGVILTADGEISRYILFCGKVCRFI